MTWREKLRVRFSSEIGKELGLHTIYIWPNKNGWMFMMVILALLAFGINYENNLVLILAFFLISVFLASIIYGFFNIKELKLELLENENYIHAKENAPVPILLTFKDKERTVKSLRISSKGSASLFIPDVNNGMVQQLNFLPQKRGWFKVPLLSISSSWPLGLVNIFSYINANDELLILPSKISCEYVLDKMPEKTMTGIRAHKDDKFVQKAPTQIKGKDEITGIKPYHEGDPINLIDWKQLARGRGLMIKDFSDDQNIDLYLTNQSIKSGTYEEQISKMTWIILDLAKKEQRFGFYAFGIYESPNTGRKYTKKLLEQLALLPEGVY